MNTRQTTRALLPMLLSLGLAGGSHAAQNYVYEYKGERYPYTVEQTGDNYTFEFQRNPGGESSRRRAALHVFQSVYGDYSIQPSYSDAFMKETAICFAYDSSQYTYRVCFLPNDSASPDRHRFWGFVSQVPNRMWMLTHNLLPGLGILGVVALIWRKRGK